MDMETKFDDKIDSWWSNSSRSSDFLRSATKSSRCYYDHRTRQIRFGNGISSQFFSVLVHPADPLHTWTSTLVSDLLWKPIKQAFMQLRSAFWNALTVKVSISSLITARSNSDFRNRGSGWALIGGVCEVGDSSSNIMVPLRQPKSSILWESPLLRKNTSHDTVSVNYNDSAATHLNPETSPLNDRANWHSNHIWHHLNAKHGGRDISIPAVQNWHMARWNQSIFWDRLSGISQVIRTRNRSTAGY
jgi:hypothetical protein